MFFFFLCYTCRLWNCRQNWRSFRLGFRQCSEARFRTRKPRTRRRILTPQHRIWRWLPRAFWCSLTSLFNKHMPIWPALAKTSATEISTLLADNSSLATLSPDKGSGLLRLLISPWSMRTLGLLISFYLAFGGYGARFQLLVMRRLTFVYFVLLYPGIDFW